MSVWIRGWLALLIACPMVARGEDEVDVDLIEPVTIESVFASPAAEPLVLAPCPQPVGCRCNPCGCPPAGSCNCCNCCSARQADPWPAALPPGNLVDLPLELLFGAKNKFNLPIQFGAYHWFTVDTTGAGRGGYGLEDFRGTYAYTLIANPDFELENGDHFGGSMLFAGRDGDNYRRYYDRRFWFLEGYVYYKTKDWGTFKAGLINTGFGLDYYLGFIGTAPYFDGFIQDPDYGVAWEGQQQVSDVQTLNFKAQYFIRDGEWNGSLRNGDQESVPGVQERNTLVLRTTSTWQFDESTSVRLGASGLVGEIRSDVPGFVTDWRSVWGLDAVLRDGPLEFRGEMLQWYGKSSPTRFASGGPSNRVTAFSVEGAYLIGAVKYRSQYSASFDANPGGRQNIWSTGGVIKVTEYADLYVEYAQWTVDGNALFGSTTVLEGPQFVLHWHY